MNGFIYGYLKGRDYWMDGTGMGCFFVCTFKEEEQEVTKERMQTNNKFFNFL
jgi:hypothetical protein